MSALSDSITASTSVSSVKLNKRVLVASLTGSAIEWFDYFLYGTVASLVFNKLFFPNYDPVVGLMLTYLSFSLTFFVRPFGGFLFSHIGDRIGRKKTLVITLSLMGFATFGIGLLPGYDVIGIWAPILLIMLRVIQGLGISGEWGGALLLAYEYAPPGKRGAVWKRAPDGSSPWHGHGHACHDLGITAP
ncbi:MFS transporter [Pseudomonas putida]|uniref:MFS transporter n=1 Tax=Pseudomonas putida TaxID=303 RepID=UPI001C5C8F26|nr:MFS transporter [Pseudomonas putida]